MPAVLVTGAARGLGYTFLTHYAAQPDTNVFGLVRGNPKDTEARLAKDGVKNVTILKADVTDTKALEEAAKAVAQQTGGSLDLLINNAALLGEKNYWTNVPDFPSLSAIESDLTQLFQVNVVGVAFVVNTFLPLIRKGGWKKVVTISTGFADEIFALKYNVAIAAPYCISKAAVNTLVTKYHAALGPSEGILFLAISPGFVDTSEGKEMSEEAQKGAAGMVGAFADYAPDFRGPLTPEQSVSHVADVVNKATVETMGGQFVSHFGNKQWL